MNPERKEVIKVNGLTIVLIMAAIGNILTTGLIYRWHYWQLFAQEKVDNRIFTNVVGEEHRLKQEIRSLEGAPTWEETLYVQYRGNEGAEDYQQMLAEGVGE